MRRRRAAQRAAPTSGLPMLHALSLAWQPARPRHRGWRAAGASGTFLRAQGGSDSVCVGRLLEQLDRGARLHQVGPHQRAQPFRDNFDAAVVGNQNIHFHVS